jgi:hypothetical protein
MRPESPDAGNDRPFPAQYATNVLFLALITSGLTFGLEWVRLGLASLPLWLQAFTFVFSVVWAVGFVTIFAVGVRVVRRLATRG